MSDDPREESEAGGDVAPSADEPDGEGVDAILRGFFEDSSLWPVLVVALLILATVVCAVLVLAFSDRNPAAMAAVAGLLFLSFRACEGEIRARALGPKVAIIVVVWVLAVVGWLALRWSSAV